MPMPAERGRVGPVLLSPAKDCHTGTKAEGCLPRPGQAQGAWGPKGTTLPQG